MIELLIPNLKIVVQRKAIINLLIILPVPSKFELSIMHKIK